MGAVDVDPHVCVTAYDEWCVAVSGFCDEFCDETGFFNGFFASCCPVNNNSFWWWCGFCELVEALRAFVADGGHCNELCFGEVECLLWCECVLLVVVVKDGVEGVLLGGGVG